jgi:hypothetical protein
MQKLSIGVGALMLTLGIVMLFWDNRGDTMSAEERAAAERVARYEARMQQQTQGTLPQSDKPVFKSKFQEHQEKQLRYAVILMLVGGAGFMGYSFYRRFTEKSEESN